MGTNTDTPNFVVPPRLWLWLGKRETVAVLLWIVTVGTAVYMLAHAWTWFAESRVQPEANRRKDGNSGHAQIDFGGQWLMGRMVLKGHAGELYHRHRQREVLREGYPADNEPDVNRLEWHLPRSARRLARPEDDLAHDADRLMSWFMGSDAREWRTVGGAAVVPLAQPPLANSIASVAFYQASVDAVTPEVAETVEKPAIGGPLYPPVHGFFYAPLAVLDPLPAYHLFQVVATLMVFVAGLGVKVLTRGRVWWSVATLVLLLYSGTRAGLDLAQNPTVTLSIAVWGWALASRGYNTAGGVVWGLFAFKPVWALAFCIVPLLTRRWRFCSAMIVTGTSLCAATLPFVGVQAWLDWLEVGKKAAALYNVNQNWIMLSRDLQSIPRRMLHDFNLPEAERDTAGARALAWTLWAVVFSTTVGIYLRYADRRRATGIGMAFLFFGAWLTCYRFMYYDVLISAIGFAVLFGDPGRFLRTRLIDLSVTSASPLESPRKIDLHKTQSRFLGSRLLGYINSLPITVLVLLLVVENSLYGMAIEGTVGFGYYSRVTTGPNGTTGLLTPRIVVGSSSSYPWDTFLVVAIWLWCGFMLIRGEERPAT